MLTSIVLGYLAGRMGEPAAEIESVSVSFEQTEVLPVACEFVLWSLIVLTAAALIWMLAPAVVALVRMISPALASDLSLRSSPDCQGAGQDWYLVKRALIGYAGLAIVFAMSALTWHVVRRRRGPQTNKVRRWMVVVDDADE